MQDKHCSYASLNNGNDLDIKSSLCEKDNVTFEIKTSIITEKL